MQLIIEQFQLACRKSAPTLRMRNMGQLVATRELCFRLFMAYQSTSLRAVEPLLVRWLGEEYYSRPPYSFVRSGNPRIGRHALLLMVRIANDLTPILLFFQFIYFVKNYWQSAKHHFKRHFTSNGQKRSKRHLQWHT